MKSLEARYLNPLENTVLNMRSSSVPASDKALFNMHITLLRIRISNEFRTGINAFNYLLNRESIKLLHLEKKKKDIFNGLNFCSIFLKVIYLFYSIWTF